MPQVSLGEYLALMKEALSGGYSLVVFEDSGAKELEIVGAGMYMLKSKDEEVLQVLCMLLRLTLSV